MVISQDQMLFPDAFRANVNKYADKPAVWDDASMLTYRQLDRITDLLAEKLLNVDARKGSRALVYLPRCKEVLVSAIGALKAGYVYVPTDASYPLQRLNYMKADSHAICICTTHAQWAEKPLEIVSERLIFLDEIDAAASLKPETVFPNLAPEDAAFVVYTSGSTGNPKGVIHDHRSLRYIANWHPATELPEDENSKFCHIAGFSFVQGMIDLFSALMFGGSTVIFPEEVRRDPPKLYAKLREHKITCFNTSTRLAILMLENYDMRGIKVRLGGEKVSNFKPLYPTKVTEIYGSSEGSMICTADLIGSENPMPLGRPCEGVEVMLIDDALEPVPVGDVGEFVFSGPNVAREYLNLPELNREKWFERNGKRWFRTGDLACVDAAGMYYYVQRKDYMIKLRGFRVEPGEIEKQVEIAGDGKIVSSVCVLKAVAGEDRLCCYFEAKQKIDIDALKQKLGLVLAEYLIPEIFMQLDALPKNLNGKLDRSALPQPEEPQKSEDEIMTSLGIMILAAEAYEKYGVSVSFEELYRVGNRKRMLELIESRRGTEAPAAEAEDAAAGTETAPLCFSQIGVYADCMARPDSLMYNLPVFIKMPMGTKPEVLEKALLNLIDAHPYLNVRIESAEDGSAVQRLCPLPDGFRIPRRTLSEDALPRFKRDSIRPFRLDGSEPLYRMEIIETESGCILFADFHHLIFDGSSFSCFCRDLCALLNGGEARSERLNGIQLAAQQQALRNSPSFEDLHSFWTSRLSLTESATEVLPDLETGSEIAGNEAFLRLDLDPAPVRALAKRIGTNASGVYLAALLYMLSAYTAESAVGIVTISNGRRNLKLANSYGMFVNTLPITAIIPDGSVDRFIRDIQNTLDEAILNESYPFANLAKEFGFRPNIMFAYQEDLLDNSEENDFSLEDLGQGNAKFPLYFSVTGRGEALSLELRYDESRYSQEFMSRMLRTYDHCIQQFCVCDTLESVTFCDAEQSAELAAFNPKAAPYTETETIVSMFRKAARTYPDNTAVVFMDAVLNYRQLDAATDRIAGYIRKHFVGKNQTDHEPVVSILVRRGLNMVVCALAALKAGCAYQPLDPGYPAERIAYMISDAQPVLLIADSVCLPLADSFTGGILKTEEIPGLPETEEALQADIRPEDLFILLYTSGSTGKPKGVMLEHQNLTAFCRWYQRYYDLKPEHKVAGYASFGFDACMMDLYPALTTGACVHIIPEEMRLDLNAINDYFEKNSITHSFMTTQVGVQFHQTQKNRSLRHLSVGGEKLVSVEPGEGYVFHNGYGPTECTIFSTTMPVLKRESNIPIGRPVDSLRCMIVDKKLRRLPIGACGELVLSGAQVGRGYLNLPEKTTEVFLQQDGVRLYRTGDIVRYRVNGDIEFVGRKDGQVKIRGFRVELKEVEASIREFDGITDATVQAFDAPEGGKFLAAYIVCDDALRIDDLKSHILANKPAYMLPASITRISAIPLNVNQKVDRKALPAPVFSAESDYVAPETDTERIVAAAIARVTGTQGRVSALDGFAELGGDSINALRLSTELAKDDLEITPNLILRLDTVREIAKAVRSMQPAKDKYAGGFTGSVVNSAIVQYFYDLKLNRPEYFNQAMLYKAGSPISMRPLSQALDALVRHHDMLRAVSRDGHLYVRDIKEGTMYTLTEDSAEDLESKANALQSGFDLENGPLMRVCVFHAAACDYLLIVLHHLIVDGVSWRILTEDLNAAYEAAASDQEVRFPAPTAAYSVYAEAQQRYRKSLALTSQRPYWDGIRSRLSQLPCTDRGNGLPRFERLTLNIDPDLTKALLKEYGTAQRHRMNDLFLAALGMSYYALTGETALSIRLEGHGRELFDPDLCIDRTVGWFTSIYPVILEHLDQALPIVMRETKETLRRIPMNGFGYGILYGIETQKMPLITFNYLGNMSETPTHGLFSLTGDHSVGNSIAPENRYGTDINLNGLLIGDGMTFYLDYDHLRYTQAQMRLFADGFSKALVSIAAHLQSAPMLERTASDLGEYEWTDAELRFVTRDFAERGEKIIGVYPMSKSMLRVFYRSILSPDSPRESIHAPIQISGHFTKEAFLEALRELYDLYYDLRFAVAFYGVSKPRLVETDRKPEMLYLDYSMEKDPYLKMLKTQSDLEWYSIDLQIRPMMQLTVIRTAEDEHYLLFDCHRLLYDLPYARARIDDYLRLLAARASGETNIREWRDLMRVGSIHALNHSAKEKSNNEGQLKTDYEYAVANMFELLLDVDAEDLTPDSDFCELGGDKYLCVKLSDMILEAYQRIIPPVVLCEHSTIRKIAARIESGDMAEDYEDIHVYSNHPDKKKLIFIHTANTGSEAYYKLAKYLEDSCSFIALEQYNINHPNSPKEDIPSLAAKYIEIVKRVQPRGPYNLGGWCFGGTVAYEMARQLTLAGEQVEKLTLLDSHIIETEELKTKLLGSSAAHSREYLSSAPLFEGIRKKGLLERYIGNAARATHLWLDYDPPKTENGMLYVKASVKAKGLSGASDEMYDHILNLKAAGYEKRVPAEKLRIISVPKDHDSLMDDDALQLIVPAIKDYLDE